MPEISDWSLGTQQSFLVFAHYKTGKTAGAATFPRPNFIDFDKGIATVASKWWQEKFNADGKRKILYEQFTEKTKNSRGIVTVPNAFDDACRYFDEYMKKSGGKWNGKDVGVDQFDTWVLDSGTTLIEFASNKARYLLGGKMPGSKSDTQKNAESHGLVVLKMQDYGAERSMTEQFISMLLDSGKHVVVLAHEKEVTRDDGVIEAIIPIFTGQSSERIPLKFNEVYRLRTRKAGSEMKRLLQTQPDGIAQVGSRLGVPNDCEWSWDAIQLSLANKEK